MNFVDPIRDRKKITQIKNQFRGEKRYRDLLLFVVGINTALRVSDLVKLQVGDFVDETGQSKSKFSIQEEKRGKRQEVVINDSMSEAFGEYRAAYPGIEADPDHSLFFNTKTGNFKEPIKRGQVWKVIAAVCEDVGLRGNFGTHSLRKTWGYHARLSGVDLALIMHKLNHNSLAYTKRYLGITDDELEAVVRKLNL
jgi:integrase